MIEKTGDYDVDMVALAFAAAGITANLTKRSAGRDTGGDILPALWIDTEASTATVQAVLDGVGVWTLVADGTDGASDITISGADAACVWSVVFGGEVIASETDNSAPYAVTLAAPVAAGTYVIWAVATDGTKTGYIEIEVE